MGGYPRSVLCGRDDRGQVRDAVGGVAFWSRNCREHCSSIASLAANVAIVEPTLSRGDGEVAFAAASALAAELAAVRRSLRTALAITQIWWLHTVTSNYQEH
jgi:hypothetical protein